MDDYGGAGDLDATRRIQLSIGGKALTRSASVEALAGFLGLVSFYVLFQALAEGDLLVMVYSVAAVYVFGHYVSFANKLRDVIGVLDIARVSENLRQSGDEPED